MAKILIAEDDLKLRAVLARFVAPGNEVFEAKDGAEALAMAREHQPDIVLLDIYMPKTDGVTILKELVPEMPRTGFLVVTGNEDDRVAQECLEYGAFDYITKPINYDELRETIEARLKGVGR